MPSSSSSRGSNNSAATSNGRYDESVAKSNAKPGWYNQSTVGRTFPSNASISTSQATTNYSPGASPQIDGAFYGNQSHASSGGNQVTTYSQLVILARLLQALLQLIQGYLT